MNRLSLLSFWKASEKVKGQMQIKKLYSFFAVRKRVVNTQQQHISFTFGCNS